VKNKSNSMHLETSRRRFCGHVGWRGALRSSAGIKTRAARCITAHYDNRVWTCWPVLGLRAQSARHEVLLFEAQARAGDRVKTVREGLAFGLTAEAGAARIPATHEFTLHYVREFGLTLEPFRPTGLGDTYYFRSRRFRTNANAVVDWPLDLTPQERKAGPTGLAEQYIEGSLRALGPSGSNTQLPSGLLPYDGITFRRFLADKGFSQDAIALLMLGYDPDLGSAAWWLLDELNLHAAEPPSRIKGGSDLLPTAFAGRLESRLHYGSPVVEIGQDEFSAWVVIERHGERQSVRGDHVILCCSVLCCAQHVFRCSARLRQAGSYPGAGIHPGD
jgi:monoamine oxidase